VPRTHITVCKFGIPYYRIVGHQLSATCSGNRTDDIQDCISSKIQRIEINVEKFMYVFYGVHPDKTNWNWKNTLCAHIN